MEPEGLISYQLSIELYYAFSVFNTFKYHVFAPMGRFSVRINLTLFSTVLPSNSRLFLSYRPFVVITTFFTGLVGVEVTSVSWLGQLTYC